LSIQIVNQAGTWGVTNETTNTARPATVSLPRRCGLTGVVTQKGSTDRIGDCGDSRQGCPGVLSQRRLPMIIAWVPLLMLMCPFCVRAPLLVLTTPPGPGLSAGAPGKHAVDRLHALRDAPAL
jgi:hypothetical protein